MFFQSQCMVFSCCLESSNNIKVPVNERGNVKHPVNTDELILNVCNDKLGLDINLHDIGRSHIIGNMLLNVFLQ
jgi:hypothetical protein